MKQRGGVIEDEGGTSLVVPILHGKNSTVKSYAGYDIIDTTPQQGISAAEYNWKQVSGSVTISGEEEFKNSGSKTRILNLLESKISQLEISMALEVNRQIFRDGTGNGGKDITGLEIAVENGSTFATYGGIDSDANSYWRNQWTDSTAATLANFIGEMTTVYNNCMRGMVRPGIVVTDITTYGNYEKFLRSAGRLFPQENTLGEIGFQHLAFKSTPIIFDDDVKGSVSGTDTGVMYFLTLEFMKFVLGRGKNFVVTEFQKPENQDAMVSQILFYGNLTTSNRARQGRLDGIADTLT